MYNKMYRLAHVARSTLFMRDAIAPVTIYTHREGIMFCVEKEKPFVLKFWLVLAHKCINRGSSFFLHCRLFFFAPWFFSSHFFCEICQMHTPRTKTEIKSGISYKNAYSYYRRSTRNVCDVLPPLFVFIWLLFIVFFFRSYDLHKTICLCHYHICRSQKKNREIRKIIPAVIIL